MQSRRVLLRWLLCPPEGLIITDSPQGTTLELPRLAVGAGESLPIPGRSQGLHPPRRLTRTVGLGAETRRASRILLHAERGVAWTPQQRRPTGEAGAWGPAIAARHVRFRLRGLTPALPCYSPEGAELLTRRSLRAQVLSRSGLSRNRSLALSLVLRYHVRI